jgi:hypothetical protein
MQRHFGGLKKPYNPAGGIAQGVNFVNKITQASRTPADRVFFETAKQVMS